MNDISFTLGQVTQAMNTAAARGYDWPKEFQRHRDIQAEAEQAAQTPMPSDTPPDTAKAVAAWIKSAAKARVEWREAKEIAVGLAEASLRNSIQAALPALPGYIDEVAAEFLEHIAAFSDLINTAPRSVEAHTPIDQIERYQALPQVCRQPQRRRCRTHRVRTGHERTRRHGRRHGVPRTRTDQHRHPPPRKRHHGTLSTPRPHHRRRVG